MKKRYTFQASTGIEIIINLLDNTPLRSNLCISVVFYSQSRKNFDLCGQMAQ